MDGFASLGVTSHETQPVLLPGAPLVSGPSLACWMHEYGVFKVSFTADVHSFMTALLQIACSRCTVA